MASVKKELFSLEKTNSHNKCYAKVVRLYVVHPGRYYFDLWCAMNDAVSVPEGSGR